MIQYSCIFSLVIISHLLIFILVKFQDKLLFQILAKLHTGTLNLLELVSHTMPFQVFGNLCFLSLNRFINEILILTNTTFLIMGWYRAWHIIYCRRLCWIMDAFFVQFFFVAIFWLLSLFVVMNSYTFIYSIEKGKPCINLNPSVCFNFHVINTVSSYSPFFPSKVPSNIKHVKANTLYTWFNYDDIKYETNDMIQGPTNYK